MNILIIGGTRFVGYQLAWRLIAAGHRLTLLNRGSRPDPFGNRVERIVADRKTSAFSEALNNKTYDRVIDFAAYTGEDTQSAIFTLNGRVGHYVMISTGQVYLVREGCPRPSSELDYDGPLIPKPQDPFNLDEWEYGMFKRDAENALAKAWAESQFPSTRLRIPMVNGELDHFRRIESYVWRILDGGPLLLPDGGNHAVRHVYSGSIVDAIINLLGQESTFGRAYNLAQDETPTLRELINMISRSLGASCSILDIPLSDLKKHNLTPHDLSPFSEEWMSFLDPTVAKAELGFVHVPLPIYLDRIISCLINHPPSTMPEGYKNRGVELVVAGGM